MMPKTTKPKTKREPVEASDHVLCLIGECGEQKPGQDMGSLCTAGISSFFDHVEANHPGYVEKDEAGKRILPRGKQRATCHMDGRDFFAWEYQLTRDEEVIAHRAVTRPRHRNDPMRYD
jgi:hypothetical protein